MRSRLLHRIADIVAATGFVAPLAVALAALSGSDHRLPDIVAHFTAPALAATAICLLVAVCLRLKTAMVSGFLALVLLVIAVWPQWFPDTREADENAPVLTVYSANLYALNTDVEAMSASIAAARPDIVMLVELGDAPASQLDRLLPDHPFRFVSAPGNITVAPSRTLIASRWPIEPIPENRKDRVSALAAIAQTPLGPTGLMSVHLTRPWPYVPQQGQIAQVKDLSQLGPKLGRQAIVTGDFNSISSGRIGRQVKQSMNLIPAPARLGTWPTSMPAVFGMTIDQVWYSDELAVLERKLGEPTGSDHRPVITRFTQSRRPH